MYSMGSYWVLLEIHEVPVLEELAVIWDEIDVCLYKGSTEGHTLENIPSHLNDLSLTPDFTTSLVVWLQACYLNFLSSSASVRWRHICFSYSSSFEVLWGLWDSLKIKWTNACKCLPSQCQVYVKHANITSYYYMILRYYVSMEYIDECSLQ